MSRVITFSTRFPAYHPRAGEPTYFVDKLIKSFRGLGYAIHDIDHLAIGLPKRHTIRAGNRWKAGDKFSPRVWSGKPYRSSQVTLADDVEIRKVWVFAITGFEIFIDGRKMNEMINEISSNDGFSDIWNLLSWFKYPTDFSGQIICWDDTVNY